MRCFIFSYNRGAFLENCTASILRNIPTAQITIIDDNSDDPATLAILARLPSAQVSVITPKSNELNRHGGLYANMQLALDSCSADEVIFFCQDDMQVVRKLEQQDLQYIAQFFQQNSAAAFLNASFFRGARRKKNKLTIELDNIFPVYFRKFGSQKKAISLSYVDVVIAHAGRLKAKQWQFSQSELTNAEQAFTYYGRMGFMVHPFVMHVPQVPVFRGRNKTLGVSLANYFNGDAPNIFYDFSEQENNLFKSRDLQLLPVAEDYLNCANKKVRKPFQLSSVNAFPLCRILHKLELLIKK